LRNLVLLCDVDHGLAHDLGLVVARAAGRLVVTAPDGRHVWGTADAAFRAGPAGLDAEAASDEQYPTTADPFTGVHPVDVEVSRRPVEVSEVQAVDAGARPASCRAADGDGAPGTGRVASRRHGRRRCPARLAAAAGCTPGRGSRPPPAGRWLR
jgi:hypothetical protein